MGSPEGEAGRSASEGPQRWVNVGPFAIGRYEVTMGEWRSLMNDFPRREGCSGPIPKFDDCPVDSVSWNDAREFVRRLSQRTGKVYRLPTEAEWEYAARAGSTTAYPWGDTFDRSKANHGAGKLMVGHLPRNAFSLHDMSGNVWEWVQDAWHDSHRGAPTDGSARDAADRDAARVVRGGAHSLTWQQSPFDLRSAARRKVAPDARENMIGIRVARAL